MHPSAHGGHAAKGMPSAQRSVLAASMVEVSTWGFSGVSMTGAGDSSQENFVTAHANHSAGAR
jgi:hypothetical protein